MIRRNEEFEHLRVKVTWGAGLRSFNRFSPEATKLLRTQQPEPKQTSTLMDAVEQFRCMFDHDLPRWLAGWLALLSLIQVVGCEVRSPQHQQSKQRTPTNPHPETVSNLLKNT